MSIGSTNVSLDDIYFELNSGSPPNNSFYNYINAFSWAQGPAPGNNNVSYWGWGVKTGVEQDILHGPYANGVTAGRSVDYKFSDFKNSYGYFDQANYVIDLYIENNIPPAGRGDPPNDINLDLALVDETLSSNSICAIAGNASENGGTWGPADVSQSFTFNVEYFYVTGGVTNSGLNPYNAELYVNSTNVWNGNGNNTIAIDSTAFSSIPTNNGGFIVELYCF